MGALPTRSQVYSNDPKTTIETCRQHMLAAEQLQLDGQEYAQAVKSPDGTDWRGDTAVAAQGRAGTDEKAIYKTAQVIIDKSKAAIDILADEATPAHSATKNLIEEAQGKGFTVTDALTVSYHAPDGASDATVKQGKAAAKDYEQQIQRAAAAWWAAEARAAAQMAAMSGETAKQFDPVGALTAGEGHYDGAYLQGGAIREPDVLARLNAASTLPASDLAALADGKSITIPANKMQYLYQFAHAFDGKSPEQIAALKASLTPEAQAAMSRAFAIASNDQVKTGVPNTKGATDTTKASFIPAAGSLSNLPDGIAAELTRMDRVGTGPLINAPGAMQPPTTNLKGVGAMQDIAKIFDGSGPYLNGSEAGRSMWDAGIAYANADIDHRAHMGPIGGDVLNSDHHGYNGTATGETGVNNAVADIFAVAGQDRTDMHDILTDNPTDSERFLRAVTQEPYGDKSAQVGDQFRWIDDDPSNKINGESANAIAHYSAEHGNELKALPGMGDQNFGQANPGVAQGMAEGISPYEGQLAGAHGPDNGIRAFDNSGKGTAEGMSDMFSTFDQNHDSAATLNAAGREQYGDLLSDSAAGGQHGPNDFEAAGRLANSMSLGAQDSDLFSRETAQWQEAVHDKHADQVIDNWKTLLGALPGADKPLSVAELINGLADQPGQNPAQIQGDQIMKALIGDGNAASSRDYYAGILDGLIQANPGVAADPTLAKYLTGGQVDLGKIADPRIDAGQVETDLRLWFTYSARTMGFDLDVLNAWHGQEQDGRTRDAW